VVNSLKQMFLETRLIFHYCCCNVLAKQGSKAWFPLPNIFFCIKWCLENLQIILS